MIPHTDDALRMLAERLLTRLLPEIGSVYGQSDGMLVGLLMNAIADEVACGIDRRMQDIAGMQDLLLKGVAFHDAGDMTERRPADYTLAAVNDLHDELTRHLIALHEALEESQEDAAGLLEAEIWRYLESMTGRHAITAVP